MDFAVELISSDEIREFMEMDQDIFGTPDAFIEECFHAFQNFWVTLDGERIGAVMLALHTDRWIGEMPLPRRGTMYLCSMGFLAQYRGRGFGERTLRWAAQHAKHNACSRIVFETRASNQVMHRLARRASYAHVDTVPEFYPEPLEDALVFERTL